MPLTRQFSTRNPAMQKLIASLSWIAASRANVLIQGESGTGKELIANLIHSLSPRRTQRMVAVNCAAIPENLLESELFGHKKGAFTGAYTDHKGLFETANGGTMFLDEIGDTPHALQAKLLRVLQDRKIRSIGGKAELSLDFKLIAATHRDLKSEVEKGSFREDLFYRLNVIPLYVPPLRQRREDIPLLVSRFATSFALQYGVSPPQFSSAAMDDLCSRQWKGNVRELENFVERLLVLKQGQALIQQEDLVIENKVTGLEPVGWNFDSEDELPTLDELSDKYTRYVLDRFGQHQGEAARVLGVSRRTISRKVAMFQTGVVS